MIVFTLMFKFLQRLQCLEVIGTVSFVDDLSAGYWVYPMRQRFEVLTSFVKSKLMEKQTAKKSRCSNLIMLESTMIDSWICQNNGIGIHFTIGKHGMAKEMNRSLLEKVRCLLSNA